MTTPKPHYVSFHIIDRCDARCRHCDIWRRKADLEMPPDFYPDIARQISRWLGPVEIQIAGGEPLLSRNVPILIEAARDLHLPVSMTTNAYHLDDDWAERLSRWEVRYVNISLDGFRETHDRNRGVEGYFKAATEAAARLTGLGKVKPRVTCVIFKDNLGEIVEFTEWVCRQSKLFDGIFFQAMAQPFGNDYKPEWWKKAALWPDDHELLGHVLGRLLEMKTAGYPILNRNEQFAAMRRYFRHPENFSLAKCTVGEKGVTIGPEGSVRMCPYDPPVGNVLEKDLRTIWEGYEARNLRKKMSNCRTNCHLLMNCVFDKTQLIPESAPVDNIPPREIASVTAS